MKIARVETEDARWREFVSLHPDADPFHLPEWSSVISKCYGFESFVLAAEESDGEIVAGAPVVAVRLLLGGTRLVSLPFSDHCPILQRPEMEPELFFDALREYALSARARELEVRCALPEANDVYPDQVGYQFLVLLPEDPADLHASKTHRNSRNRAKRAGITVERGTSPEDVATYYRLHTATRHRLGVPVQPRRFFDLIAQEMIGKGHGFVAHAVEEGEVLASCLYLSHNRTLMAKYGASDPARRDKGASHIIDWEVMSRACADGYDIYDMGRTDLDAAGLRQYKSGWGAVERPLIYSTISKRAPARERPHVGTLSTRIIQNSPTWVCRGLGEVLYRWTA